MRQGVANMAQQVLEALLRLQSVKTATGLGRSSIYALEASGDFPKRVAIGLRAVAWRASEIQAWINSRQPKTELKAYNDAH